MVTILEQFSMKRLSKGYLFDQKWYINGYDLISSPYKALLRSSQPPTTLSLGCFLCTVSRFESKSALGHMELTLANKGIFPAGACLFPAETSAGQPEIRFLSLARC